MVKAIVFIATLISLLSASNINIDNIAKGAEKSNKHILIFLHKPHCGFCERMIKQTLKDEWISEKIKKDFIFVDVDISKTGDVTYKNFKGSKREFAKFLGYDFYPTTIFIDNKNEVIYVQPGYQDEMNFLDILEYIDSNLYEDMSIEDFKKRD